MMTIFNLSLTHNLHAPSTLVALFHIFLPIHLLLIMLTNLLDPLLVSSREFDILQLSG